MWRCVFGVNFEEKMMITLVGAVVLGVGVAVICLIVHVCIYKEHRYCLGEGCKGCNGTGRVKR